MKQTQRTPEEQLAAARIPDEEAPYELPDGWTWVRLGGVVRWSSGGTPSRKVPAYFTGDILWIKTGEINGTYIYDTEEKITKEALEHSSAKIFPVNTVLLAMYGASIGKVGIMGREAATNQACACGVCSELVDYRYLFHFLKAQKDRFIELGRGGAQPNISQTIIKNYVMPLPPLAEQHRIVRRIESLSAKLDAAASRLDAVEASFTPRFAAALRAALRGELTAAWRASQPQPPIPMELPEGAVLPPEEAPYPLPDGWQWAHLGGVYTINPRTQDDDETMASFITMADIAPGFRSDYQTTEQPWGAIKRGHTHFHTNDVAFAKISPCFENRKSMILSHLCNGIGAGTTELIVLRNGFLDTRYTYYLISDERFLRGGMATYRGIVGQQRISMDFVRQYPVPIPPHYEQREIVRRLDALLASESHARAALTAARKTLATLQTTLLARAFRGRLA